MRKKIIYLGFAVAVLFGAASSDALAGTIRGNVLGQDNTPLLGASVLVLGTAKGDVANEEGEFVISDLSPGEYTIRASTVGYEPMELNAVVEDNADTFLEFRLKQTPIELEEVTVSAESGSEFKQDAPVRTEVITGEELERTAGKGLLASLEGKTGIKTRPCALCGSANVGLQGLDGAYTQVLIDGMPVLSGLGTLYGLDGVSTTNVSRVEITKGSGDALYGEEAIAGAVNVVSRAISETPTLRLEASMGSTNQPGLSLGYSTDLGPVRINLSTDYESQLDRVDRDNDGVTDTPEYDRFQVSGQAEIPLSSKVHATMNLQALRETRIAGETVWRESDKGSAEVYGRFIETERYQGQVGIDYQWSGETELQFRSVVSDHLQNSYYGTTHFEGRQTISLFKADLNHELSSNHQLRAELRLRSEVYTDNLATEVETDYRYLFPGLTLQHRWQPDYMWTILYGSRLTHYNIFGWVATPRASIHWRPTSDWAFRLSGGGGFKPVNIFSSGKAVHTGFQDIRVSQDLDPERTVAASFAVNRRFVWPTAVALLDLNLYYTHFLDKVVVEYGETPGSLVYSLDDEGAFSRGIELKGMVSLSNGLKASAGWSWVDAFYHRDGLRKRAQMQSRYSGDVGVGWVRSGGNFIVDINGSIYGPQPLPEGRPRTESPTYSLWNLRLQKGVGPVKVFAGCKNLFDYVQPDDPFVRTESGLSESFDSAMIYGPLLGRVFYGGVNFTL